MSLKVIRRGRIMKLIINFNNMKKLSLKDFSFQREEILTRSQLKEILGGDSGSGGGSGEGRCVQCSCHSGGTSCWYSRRNSSDLCRDVCGSSYFNALEPVGCSGCTMN